MHMDDRPRRNLDRTPTSAPDGSVVVTTESGATIELNATAAALWVLCDGTTTIGEIVRAAQRFFAGSPEAIERDILRTLTELSQRDLLR